jgi:shikimate dehydrogenase
VISGTTRLAAVIGSPVRHSLSPAMHNAAYRALGLDWIYVAFEVSPGAASVAAAITGMRALELVGLNVTMPHKADVVGTVDRLTPTAEALGAVNTVAQGPGRGVLTGHNTDGPGFVDALRIDEGFDPAGKRCVVFGAGGAGRAVVRALGEAGAAVVTVVNRTPARAVAAAPLAGAAGRVGGAADAGDADLVVNATPVGMGGGGGVAIDPQRLGSGQLVVDLVYQPALTPLVEAARARGAVATNGLGTLIHQAAHAIRLWTGEDPPLEVMSAAALGELARRG